ncbi:uncharacterized protein FA14DRAFT_192393 [Meira miltonrushii]|uniref:Uncharacterized protein n=1 Tax=Meira miltonrushii TaxID=1280837 RepID=A0A316V3K6_9BASI|nr:uncharacterized protein FA14DRAFT_192393 [Meira miltonrushii]PWN32139.1 hypothetical protein FA14DRAFT_192393 [Meira miltonrushii]
MRIAAAAFIIASAASLVAGQGSSSPFGPLTTNNGISACVQYGSCTESGVSFASTETQQSPITPPASSVHYAQPTNAAESSASIAALAASGASAAYASRVAHGQGSGGAADGATTPVDTASVIAGTPPGTVTAPARTGSSDGAARLDVGYTGLWASAFAIVGMALGGAFVL